MGHENRGRITVDTNGKWGLYTNTIPVGSEALGTVTLGIGDTGALVRMQSGVYVQINAGALRSLDARKVAAALGQYSFGGRPKTIDGARRVNMYLDEHSIAKAKELGRGNLSEGIRAALIKAQL